MIFCFHIFCFVFINILITPFSLRFPWNKNTSTVLFFLCHGFCSWQSCRKDLFSFYFQPTIRSEFCQKQPDLFCFYDIPKWKLGARFSGRRQTAHRKCFYGRIKKYNAWYAADTDEKKIYLTFDAGYDNGNMPAILNALHKHQVHATFLLWGLWSVKNRNWSVRS